MMSDEEMMMMMMMKRDEEENSDQKQPNNDDDRSHSVDGGWCHCNEAVFLFFSQAMYVRHPESHSQVHPTSMNAEAEADAPTYTAFRSTATPMTLSAMLVSMLGFASLFDR